MNKSDFIIGLEKRSEFSLRDLRHMVDLVLEEITAKTAAGERVSFTGFGTFVANGHGDKKVPVFRPGAKLVAAVEEAPDPAAPSKAAAKKTRAAKKTAPAKKVEVERRSAPVAKKSPARRPGPVAKARPTAKKTRATTKRA